MLRVTQVTKVIKPSYFALQDEPSTCPRLPHGFFTCDSMDRQCDCGRRCAEEQRPGMGKCSQPGGVEGREASKSYRTTMPCLCPFYTDEVSEPKGGRCRNPVRLVLLLAYFALSTLGYLVLADHIPSRGTPAHNSSQDKEEKEKIVTVGFYSAGGTRLLPSHVRRDGSFKSWESRAGKR